MPRQLSERALVFLVGAVQFVNILDFMMVMPLGPDFAAGLGIDTAHLGYVGGAYTAAAAVSGLAGSFFLERFDRRRALAVCMFGLVVGTALGGFAVDLPTLIGARVLAGAFGGPATSLALAIVADVVPVARRGKAMGSIMAAFAVASVVGVPAGLELARQGGWRLPFFAVAGLGLVVAAAALSLLPPMRHHIEARQQRATEQPGAPELTLGDLLRRPPVLLAYAVTVVVMGGSFTLIPNISTYVQHNLGYPRDGLGMLYLVGGTVSFFATRAVGRLVDAHGPTRVGSLGCAMLMAIVFAGFWLDPPVLPVPVTFVAFFLAMSFRNVPFNTLMSMVPGPAERARFMSLQSAVQHLAASAGAFAASELLWELPGGKLGGMPAVAALSMGMTVVLPLLFWQTERRVQGVGGGRV